MILLFRPEQLPRTMTREEWKEAWRWVRITERRLSKLAEDCRMVVADKSLPTKLRIDAAEKLINPPIVVYPFNEPL